MFNIVLDSNVNIKPPVALASVLSHLGAVWKWNRKLPI